MVIKSRENLIGAWAFSVGIIIAVLCGLLASFYGGRVDPFILLFLSLLGVIVAYFVAEKDVMTFLLASVSLVIVTSLGIQGLVISSAIRGISVSQIISTVLGALLFLFIPSTIVVAIKTVFSIARR